MAKPTRHEPDPTPTPTVDVNSAIGILRMTVDDHGTWGRSSVQVDWSHSVVDTKEDGTTPETTEMGAQRHTPTGGVYSIRADSGTPEGRDALVNDQLGPVIKLLTWAGVTDPQGTAITLLQQGNHLDRAIENHNGDVRDAMLAWWDSQAEPTLAGLFAQFGRTPVGDHPFK